MPTKRLSSLSMKARAQCRMVMVMSFKSKRSDPIMLKIFSRRRFCCMQSSCSVFYGMVLLIRASESVLCNVGAHRRRAFLWNA